jgi:hypothetical protein
MGTIYGQGTGPANDSSFYHLTGRDSLGWLSRRRGLIIAGAVTTAVAALALGQHWLTVAGLTPLLFVLPCAAMMFMCMKGMNHGQQTKTTPTTNYNESLTATETRD